jgi:site-specific DNA-cytosine methylase
VVLVEMSLGFQNAGCEILGRIDNNPYAIKNIWIYLN